MLFIGGIPGQSSIKPGFLFPIEMQIRFLVEAVLVTATISTLAAMLPARRAALMNPADVIRQG